MIILKEEEIKKALTMKEAMEVNKEAFIQQASQKATVPERIQIPAPEYVSFIIQLLIILSA